MTQMSKPVATVKMAWINWYPHMGWNADFWLAVAKTAKKRGVRSGDKYAILRICREVASKHRQRTKR